MGFPRWLLPSFSSPFQASLREWSRLRTTSWPPIPLTPFPFIFIWVIHAVLKQQNNGERLHWKATASFLLLTSQATTLTSSCFRPAGGCLCGMNQYLNVALLMHQFKTSLTKFLLGEREDLVDLYHTLLMSILGNYFSSVFPYESTLRYNLYTRKWNHFKHPVKCILTNDSPTYLSARSRHGTLPSLQGSHSRIHSHAHRNPRPRQPLIGFLWLQTTSVCPRILHKWNTTICTLNAPGFFHSL